MLLDRWAGGWLGGGWRVLWAGVAPWRGCSADGRGLQLGCRIRPGAEGVIPCPGQQWCGVLDAGPRAVSLQVPLGAPTPRSWGPPAQDFLRQRRSEPVLAGVLGRAAPGQETGVPGPLSPYEDSPEPRISCRVGPGTERGARAHGAPSAPNRRPPLLTTWPRPRPGAHEVQSTPA